MQGVVQCTTVTTVHLSHSSTICNHLLFIIIFGDANTWNQKSWAWHSEAPSVVQGNKAVQKREKSCQEPKAPSCKGTRTNAFTLKVIRTHTHTTVLLLVWNMSGSTWVSRYQKGKTKKVKTNLDLMEQEIVSGSGICWAICKSAPHADNHAKNSLEKNGTFRWMQKPKELAAVIHLKSGHQYEGGSGITMYHFQIQLNADRNIPLYLLPTGNEIWWNVGTMFSVKKVKSKMTRPPCGGNLWQYTKPYQQFITETHQLTNRTPYTICLFCSSYK